MSISYIPEQKEYKHVGIFKRYIMQNFPWINEDFDALTNNELLAKVIEYLNDVIENSETEQENIESLYNAFVELHDYVKNYFDNLDVQDEINNKLDVMAGDGTLEEIINQQIFGQINEDLTNLTNRVANDEIKPTVFIGDSYGQVTDSWIDKVGHKLGLVGGETMFKIAQGQYGFSSPNRKWLDLLQERESMIPDKLAIRRFIVCGGLNDSEYTNSLAGDITAFVNYVKTNYPNAHIYLGCIGWTKVNASVTQRNNMQRVLSLYQRAGDLFGLGQGISYLSGVEYVMHEYAYYDETETHPTNAGQIFLAKAIYNALYGKASWTEANMSVISENGLRFVRRVIDNHGQIAINGVLSDISMIDTTTVGTKNVKICDLNNFFRKVNELSLFGCNITLVYPTAGRRDTYGSIVIQTDGIYINFYNPVAEQVNAVVIARFSTGYNVMHF